MGLGLGSGGADRGGSAWGAGHGPKSSSAGPELGGPWLSWWREKGKPKIQCSRHGVTGSAIGTVDADKAEGRQPAMSRGTCGLFPPISLFGGLTDTGRGHCQDKARYSDRHVLRGHMRAITPQQPDLGSHLAVPKCSPSLAQGVTQNVQRWKGIPR